MARRLSSWRLRWWWPRSLFTRWVTTPGMARVRRPTTATMAGGGLGTVTGAATTMATVTATARGIGMPGTPSATTTASGGVVIGAMTMAGAATAERA